MSENPPVRPFGDWLRDQNRGQTHDELSEALYELVGKVNDTGKKGTLTYTVTVEPMKNNPDVLVVKDTVKVKSPEIERKPSMFFTDRHGNLTRNDPNQLEFESLREVPAPAAPKTAKEA